MAERAFRGGQAVVDQTDPEAKNDGKKSHGRWGVVRRKTSTNILGSMSGA
jgi:hypothetical protein